MSLRVVTYNIHSCIGVAGSCRPEKIAKVIAGLDAHVVALQEVDAGRPRSAKLDQSRWLAERLGMQVFFFPLLAAGSEKYGLAILSVIPMQKVRFGRLPAPALKKPLERRGAMWVRLYTSAGAVHLINTHLGLRPVERRLQIDALLSKDWIGGLSPNDPVVFCGDLNAGRRSYVYRQVSARLLDAQPKKAGFRSARATFFSFYPFRCLDHIFFSDHFKLLRTSVATAPPARTASDHLPLAAEIALRPHRIGSKKVDDSSYA